MMCHVATLCLLLLPLGGLLCAGGLEDAQDATIFLKVYAGKEYFASGSGFVVEATDKGLSVVTNHHVVAGDGAQAEISFVGVLRSGTPNEESFPLEIRALDEARDLALLHAPPVARPPKPIRLTEAATVRKGQEVHIIGYPFGEMLDLAGKNPVFTLSRAKVVHPYERGIQNDGLTEVVGGADHGNSGGPVVDSRGRLAGVLVAGCRATHHVHIIPPEYVQDLWNGVLLLGPCSVRSSYGTTVNVDASVQRCDAMERIAQATLVCLPKKRVTGETTLRQFHDEAAKFSVVPLPELPAAPGAWHRFMAGFTIPEGTYGGMLMAVRVQRKDGSEWFGQPVHFPFTTSARPVSLQVDFSRADTVLAAIGEGGAAAAPGDTLARDYAFRSGKLGAATLVPCVGSGDMRITHVGLRGSFSCRPVWADEGRTAYALDREGWVLRIALPSFERTDACRLVRASLGEEDHSPPTRHRPEKSTSTQSYPDRLARSRSFLLALSRSGLDAGDVRHDVWGRVEALGMGRSGDIANRDIIKATPAWIQVIDTASFRTTGFFAVPGVVDVSAVPESDRILLRYFSGELGLLDPHSGAVRLICRAGFTPGLAVPADPPPVLLPVRLLDAAVLISPGDRVLVSGDGKAFPVHLGEDGTATPPGAATPVWPDCGDILYEPGAPVALLVDSRALGTDLPHRLLDLASLRTVETGAARKPLCLDARNGVLADIPNVPLFRRQPARGEGKRDYNWSFPKGSDLRLESDSNRLVVAHPRGNCFWMQLGGKLFWIEFGGTPWVHPTPGRASLPLAPQQPRPQGERS